MPTTVTPAQTDPHLAPQRGISPLGGFGLVLAILLCFVGPAFLASVYNHSAGGFFFLRWEKGFDRLGFALVALSTGPVAVVSLLLNLTAWLYGVFCRQQADRVVGAVGALLTIVYGLVLFEIGSTLA